MNDRLSEELLLESVKKESHLHEAVEVTQKGKELRLPAVSGFGDKDGNERREVRVKWWENALGQTYRSYSLEGGHNIPNELIPEVLARQFSGYPEDAKPVFFGHYWLKGEPKLFGPNVYCVDYSVA